MLSLMVLLARRSGGGLATLLLGLPWMRWLVALGTSTPTTKPIESNIQTLNTKQH